MTPDERQLITGLFDRMRDNGQVDKDHEAERLINQAVRQTPDAAYLLVQSVLAQEHYLQQAGNRIQDLEARMQELEDELSRQQQAQAPQRSGGGSFLGGLFGGGRQAEQPAQRSGSVPAFGARREEPRYGEAGSPWGQQGQQRGAPVGAGYAQGGYQPQMAPQGGGFMRSALTTAAGVAGGMLAANALSGIFSGGSGAQASGHPTSSQSSGESSPFAVDNAADNQRQLDEQQDLAQDAELENEQVASYQDDSSADWGSSDDSDY